jgi:hypothetical protein
MEEFRKVQGFENYSISNYGNVKNNNNEVITQIRMSGYKAISIKNAFGIGQLFIHRLVAFHFLKNTENKRIVDHIDGDKSNNNMNNLRWVTYSENNKNRKICKKNNTGCSGVHKLINGKFQVKLGSKYLGTVQTYDEAVILRNNAINNNAEWLKMSRKNKVEELDELDLFHLQK